MVFILLKPLYNDFKRKMIGKVLRLYPNSPPSIADWQIESVSELEQNVLVEFDLRYSSSCGECGKTSEMRRFTKESLKNH